MGTTSGEDAEAHSGRRTWFVTGASSGLGAAITRAALDAGQRVAATARDARDVANRFPEASPMTLLPLDLDLRDSESVRAAVASAQAAFGDIDVLVNSAGFVTFGGIEELDSALLREQLEVNLVGPLEVVRAVLPRMRERRAGRIVQLSSLGGRVAIPGLGAYNASKFASEGAFLALADEVAEFGISVTLIEPGDFRTPALSAGRLVSAPPTPDYASTVGRTRGAIARLDGNQPGDPDLLADVVARLVTVDDPPRQLALGSDAYVRIEEQLMRQLGELRQWQTWSTSTDFAS